MNGLVVGRWSDFGIRVITEYPQNFRKDNDIEDNRLQTIFNDRIVQDNPGFDTIVDGEMTIATYISPIMNGYYNEGNDSLSKDPGQGIVFLFLDKEQKIDGIKEQFVEFSISILKIVDDNNFPELFFNIIDNFAFLNPLSEEQRYAAIYNNEIREQLLKKLGEGPISRDDLEQWILTTFNLEYIDFNGMMSPFLKTGLVKQSYDGITSKKKKSHFYLVRDVYLFRIPPRKLIDAFKRGKLDRAKPETVDYLNEVMAYFDEYELTPTDITRNSRLLTIPNIYNIILLLREGMFEIDEFRIDFLESFNFLPSNFNYLLKLLEKAEILKIYKKGKNTYLVLMSDIQFQVFFPEYIVDNIRKSWRENKIDRNLAVKHLTFLRDEYMENFMKLKGKSNNNKTVPSDFNIDDNEPGDVKQKASKITIVKRMENIFGRII
ncbi:MAG: hypothetical protein ACTSUE_16475 [Promethearchaeota archaeon]